LIGNCQQLQIVHFPAHARASIDGPDQVDEVGRMHLRHGSMLVSF
jgi:hypothetical protein